MGKVIPFFHGKNTPKILEREYQITHAEMVRLVPDLAQFAQLLEDNKRLVIANETAHMYRARLDEIERKLEEYKNRRKKR